MNLNLNQTNIKIFYSISNKKISFSEEQGNEIFCFNDFDSFITDNKICEFLDLYLDTDFDLLINPNNTYKVILKPRVDKFYYFENIENIYSLMINLPNTKSLSYGRNTIPKTNYISIFDSFFNHICSVVSLYFYNELAELKTSLHIEDDNDDLEFLMIVEKKLNSIKQDIEFVLRTKRFSEIYKGYFVRLNSKVDEEILNNDALILSRDISYYDFLKVPFKSYYDNFVRFSDIVFNKNLPFTIQFSVDTPVEFFDFKTEFDVNESSKTMFLYNLLLYFYRHKHTSSIKIFLIEDTRFTLKDSTNNYLHYKNIYGYVIDKKGKFKSLPIDFLKSKINPTNNRLKLLFKVDNNT